MTGLEILGWAAAVIGTLGALPQVVRLLRTRDTRGVALPFWQVMCGISASWAGHGLMVRQPNIVVQNVLIAASAALILWLIRDSRNLSVVAVFLPSVLLGALLVTADLLFGAVVFGAMAMIPGVLGAATQSAEIVRSPEVTGLSPVFLVWGVVQQAVWLIWGVLAPEISMVIMSTGLLLVLGFNLVWYLFRRGGLRAFFPVATVAD